MKLSTFFTFGLYKPFTHNPEDFKLRFVESWFSDKYVALQYSANGGKTWKTIKKASKPISNDDYWEIEYLIFPLKNDEQFFKDIKDGFPTYQSVIDYENKQKEKVNSKNNELDEQLILKRKNKVKKINKINSL